MRSDLKSFFTKIFGHKSRRHLTLRQIFLFSSIYLIVSIGCFWQIISVCQLFFSYPTLVSVETESRECENELPAFSFCTFLESSIDKTHNSNKSISEYFSLFNLSSQIFEFNVLTPDYQEINDSTLPEEIRNSLIQTINKVYVCYTFNSLIKSKGEKKYLKLWKNEILAIHLNEWWVRNRSTFLYVHDWYSIPSGWDWNTIEIKGTDRIALSFQKKIFNLLKSPYTSHCIEYMEESHFVSRHQCISSCRLNTSLAKCDVIAEEINVEVGQSGRFARTKEEIDCSKDVDLSGKCWDECIHPDCTKHYFQAIKFYTRNDANGSMVGFKIPTEPQTIYNHKPKIETIEFLCYCASLIGLWFGFSFASIYYPIKRIIDWFDSTKSKQKMFGYDESRARTHKIVMTHKMFDSIAFTNPVSFPKSYPMRAIQTFRTVSI